MAEIPPMMLTLRIEPATSPAAMALFAGLNAEIVRRYPGAAASGMDVVAFEVAFVDSSGNSLVPTIAPGRNAFFNVTEGMPAALAQGVTLQNLTVDLDISK